MRLRELESWLQQADGFGDPKMELEQYATSPRIAGKIIQIPKHNQAWTLALPCMLALRL